MRSIIFDEDSRLFSVVEDQREYAWQDKKTGIIYAGEKGDRSVVKDAGAAEDLFINPKTGKAIKSRYKGGTGTNITQYEGKSRVRKAATADQVKANKASARAYKKSAAAKKIKEKVKAAKIEKGTAEFQNKLNRRKLELKRTADLAKLGKINRNLKIGLAGAGVAAAGAGAYAMIQRRKRKKAARAAAKA